MSQRGLDGNRRIAVSVIQCTARAYRQIICRSDVVSGGSRGYWQCPRRATNFPILTAIYEPSAAARDDDDDKMQFHRRTTTSGRFMQIDVRSSADMGGGRQKARPGPKPIGAAPGGDMHAMQFQLSYVDSFVRHSTHVGGRRRINASLKSVG